MANSSPPSPSAGDDEPEELAGPDERAPATLALIITNVVVGLVMAFEGVPVLLATPESLVTFGAVDPARLWDGEIWRLFSACFVHVGAWHLGLNLWVLWQVGVTYERLVGSSRLLLVYLVSGLFGFSLSVALMPSLTAGASGAIFGLTGGLLSIARIARHKPLGRFLLTSLLPFVVATFALGLLVPMVNNVAHFGGLMMGYLLGYGLCAGDDTFVTKGAGTGVSSQRRMMGRVSLVVAIAVFAGLTFYAGRPALSPRYHAMMGLQALHTVELRERKNGDPLRQTAANHLAAARSLAKDDAGTLLLSARVAELEGRPDDALDLARKSLAAVPGDDATARVNRAALDLALIRPESDAGFADGYSMRNLCRAALQPLPDDDAPKKAPLLKNQCAWLYVTATETSVRDPARGLALAKEASAEDPNNAAINHTLACALAESGDAVEGIAVLERLSISGDNTLGSHFLKAERARLQAVADAQAAGTWRPTR